jgi:hypothetical protein
MSYRFLPPSATRPMTEPATYLARFARDQIAEGTQLLPDLIISVKPTSFLIRIAVFLVLLTLFVTTFPVVIAGAMPGHTVNDQEKDTQLSAGSSGDAIIELQTISPADARSLQDGLARMLDAIDRGQFDLSALLDELDYDHEQIISFVRNEIRLEDYPGLLRGARGTLESRAGNSLDQSTLLATLLKDAGFDARIVEGEIHSTALADAIFSPVPDPPPVFVRQGASQSLSQLFGGDLDLSSRTDVVGGDPPSVGAPGAHEDRALLSSALEDALKLRGFLVESPLEQESGSRIPYFWVEYREGSSVTWSGIHPAFPTHLMPPEDIVVLGYWTQDIGERLQQRVQVQAFIERFRSGRAEIVQVSDLYEYPAANLSGLTFSYSVIPNAFLVQEEQGPDAADQLLTKSTLFFPVFDFGTPEPKFAFDLVGNVLTAEDAATAMAPLFQTVGKGYARAGDALRLAGTSAQSAEQTTSKHGISRHWLEITLLRPGQEPKVITREIARMEDDEDRFRESLARTAYFRVETGNLSPAHFLHRGLTTYQAIVESLSSATPFSMQAGALTQFSLDAEAFLLASDSLAAGGADWVVYRTEPSIVARYYPYARIDSTREGFDIINMTRVAIASKTKQRDRAQSFRIGIGDTWLEDMLFADTDWHRSAYGRFRQRLHAGAPLHVVSEENRDLLESVPLPARALLKSQLDSGQILMLAGSPQECDAWFRVDPSTGEALGLLPNGWGGVIPEYLLKLAAIHGKIKVVSTATACGSAVAFLQASAALNALQILTLNDLAGLHNMDACSVIPSPDLQALCALTMAAAGAAAASGAAQSGLTTGVLVRICVTAALS